MIREDEIREFQEIISGRIDASETESAHSIFDRNAEFKEEFDVEIEEKEVKTENPNTVILLITGILGLVFVASVFIGAIMYIYMKNDADDSNLNKSKPSQSLKIPGIEKLVTDPEPDEKIKVWGVRTAVAPSPRIGNYYYFFSETEEEIPV
jgi:flagellar biosynthesis/type III secretory pathway M-ring protein FliF/YscJ